MSLYFSFNLFSKSLGVTFLISCDSIMGMKFLICKSSSKSGDEKKSSIERMKLKAVQQEQRK
jgi:hypothetical protein